MDDVRSVVRETKIAPGSLRLEITESVLIEHSQATATKLKELKQIPVALYLDDFGTGYSSLSYLHRFPIDALKIDRSFIASIAEEGKDEIVATIVALAHKLGMAVIAEGVEKIGQVEVLRRHRCGLAQGYYFSVPLVPLAARQLLSTAQPLIAPAVASAAAC